MPNVWEQIVHALLSEFADLPTVGGAVQLISRLLLATVLGGLLGFEREAHGKDAGLRTHMLICAGAALFVLVPQQAGMSDEGMGRVLQGVIAGVGFIGGGAILKLSEERRVEGLTTAAGIWLTAGIGIAAGMGRQASAIVGTVLALVVMAALATVSRWIAREARVERGD